jgi:D-glycero-alpha-D-manno-heptose 1-phosphate guanylyltransferase
LTMAYSFVEETSRYGTIELDATKRIVTFQEKQPGKGAGFINAGIYLFDRKLFHRSLPEAFSFETEFLPHLLQEGMYGYFSKGPLIDIGTKESYLDAQTVQILSERT